MAQTSILYGLLSTRVMRGVLAAVFVVGVALIGRTAPAAGESAAKTKNTDRTVEVGNTKPADQKPRELRFKNPGLVKEVSVAEGDPVKIGQILMTQDDEEELSKLDILIKDSSDVRTRVAERSAAAKQTELTRIEKLHSDARNEAEFEKAKAEYEIAVMQIEQEKQDRLVKLAKVEEQRKLIARLELHSPMEGIVQSVEVHPGEMGEPQKPVITIVNNNPLIVEVNLKTVVSLRMKVGDILRVSYDKKDWKDATISYLAPFATAGADRQKVHLKLPNPEGKVSGLQIYVELPETQVAAE